MGDKLNSRWRPSPSWILLLLPLLVTWPISYTTAKFHLSISNGSWVISVCAKIQDGGRRHFELLFCNAGSPTKPVCGPKLALQILCWSSLYFSRYRDLKISQIWLKMPIQASKNHVLGSFDSFYHGDPQKHFLAQKHAFWALIGRDRSYGVIWTRREDYKKRKNQKWVSQNSPFSQTSSRRPTSTKFCTKGRIPNIFLGFEFRKIG